MRLSAGIISMLQGEAERADLVWLDQEISSSEHPEEEQSNSDLLAEIAQEARETFPEWFEGKSDRDIIREIAAVIRKAEGVTGNADQA